MSSNPSADVNPLPVAPEGGAAPLGSLRSLYDGALYPDTLAYTLRHVDQLLPTRRVARSGAVRALPVRASRWPGVRFKLGEEVFDEFDYLALNRVSGLLVLKNGEVAHEQYALGATVESRWTSMSMAKSICSTLMGVALHDGYIKSLGDDVSHYLPELRGSAYEGVNLRQLLQMCSGVQWNETYTDRQSERRRMLDLQIAQQPGAILKLMASLPRAAAAGSVWNYSTGETHVMGAVLRAAVGRPVAEYLSERVWSRLGMDDDATWWLESPEGLEVGGSGLSARLRDFARFGQFVLDDGVIDGERLLPEGWVAEASRPLQANGQTVPYGYMWWPVEAMHGAVHEGAFCARGIFGQCMYIHPRERVVVVQWSALPKPKGHVPVPHEVFMGAVVQALR